MSHVRMRLPARFNRTRRQRPSAPALSRQRSHHDQTRARSPTLAQYIQQDALRRLTGESRTVCQAKA